MTPDDHWNADGYIRNAGFVADLGVPVLDILDPRPGERILDLGCGDGALTLEIAKRGADVIGVDASADMVRKARERGLEAREMSGEALTLPERFDAAFSNAALHWMADHDAVSRGVFAHLKSGGRFAGEFGGEGNVAAIVTALEAACEMLGLEAPDPWPWTFPSAEGFADHLEGAGFEDIDCRIVPRPVVLPTDMAGWLQTFAFSFTQGLEPARADALLATTERLLVRALRRPDERWIADYVRLRFTARRPR